MSETQALLSRISALRQRLEQSQGLSRQAVAAAAALQSDWHAPTPPIPIVQRKAQAGAEHDAALDQTVQGVAPSDVGRTLPRQLTWRARQVLEQSRDLIGQLRALSDAFAPPSPEPVEVDDESQPRHLLDFADPLAKFYRETAAIADTALRMIPLFPETATGQLHLCEGLSGILAVVDSRLRTLTAAVDQHQHESDMVDHLADLLTAVEAGQLAELTPFTRLAEVVLADADEGGALRFLACDPSRPPRFTAAHSLTVARVAARILRHDPELKANPLESITAALLHDVGMLRVPPAVLSHEGPLSDEQRRVVEAHCRTGAALLQQLQGEAGKLVQAAACHHERLDGAGYPDGLREAQIPSLARLLAVCDCYVSLCTTRPHRPARETRTALADTLLLAEQGQLDRKHAEHLLHLSFYPVGSAVELADGAVGIVVAAPGMKRDLNAPARPVVALLLDPDGQPLPLPRHVDLAHSDHHNIVRTLSAQEKQAVLGPCFPEWLAA
jgi:putative nucleotidyltransferase with HDIG domain